MAPETRLRICPLCEATCGLELTVEGRKVVAIRGDEQDAFSEGYICPKGVALQDLDSEMDGKDAEEHEWGGIEFAERCRRLREAAE